MHEGRHLSLCLVENYC